VEISENKIRKKMTIHEVRREFVTQNTPPMLKSFSAVKDI
jgi:hypothetical protein